ncbi:MAG: hypothetical protein JNL04_21425 [Rhodospirillaceae bacterium]|nr:hypothetical protein [Rhodospirillaceae bacterium]
MPKIELKDHPSFEQDLLNLEQAISSGLLERLANDVSEGRVNFQDALKTLGSAEVDVSMSLLLAIHDEESRQSLLNKVNVEGRDEAAQRIKNIAERTVGFNKIFGQKTLGELESGTVETRAAYGDNFIGPFARGVTVNWMSNPVIHYGKIFPAIWIEITTKGERQLFNSSLNWYDILFLVRSLNQILVADVNSISEITRDESRIGMSTLLRDGFAEELKRLQDLVVKLQEELSKFSTLGKQAAGDQA